MKILIKNRKWETSFDNTTIICDVSSENKIFNINFNFNGKYIKIKSHNLDLTFKYLENCFNKLSELEDYSNNKTA